MDDRKAKGKAAPSELLRVDKANQQESDDRAVARALLRPSVNHAATIRKVVGRDLPQVGLNVLVDELAEQCAAVSRGDMGRPEALLTAQAQTLDAVFNHLTRLAYCNWDNLDAVERLLRLAFKAQSQSRGTAETLGNLRNPPMVIARQANIAHGPQQVNNGEPTRTREFHSEPNKLLEQTNGERLDTGAASQAIDSDPAVATVGALDRPQNKRG
jgi:hypothetical protein